MSALKESAKAARLRIAGSALIYFYKMRAERVSLGTLFVAPKSASAAELTEADGAKARKWQRALLARLERDGIVSGVGGDQYEVADPIRMLAIVSNFEQDAADLARYLFAPDNEVEHDAVEALARHDDIQEANSKPVDTDDAMLSSLESLVKSIDSIAGLQRVLVEQTGKNHIAFDKNLKTAATVVEILSIDVTALREQVSQREGALGKRIEKLEGRVMAVQNVLEAMQAVHKNQAAGTSAIAERLQGITDLGQLMQRTAEVTVALQTQVSALVTRLDAAENDQLGRLVHRLDAHVTDGKELRDLVLDAVAEAKGR